MRGLRVVAGYIGRHHVGLLALALLLAGGTAYAAGLSKNSVRSPQIKNGQVKSVDLRDNGVKSVDIRNGTLGSADFGSGSVNGNSIAENAVSGPQVADDAIGATEITGGAVGADEIADGTVGAAELDPASVGNLISFGGSFANDGVAREILVIPGLGTLEAKCEPTNNFSVTYRPTPGVPQEMRFFAEDPIDGTPKVSTGFLGESAIGGGGAPFSTYDARIWSYTDEKVVRIDVQGNQSGSCLFRAQASVDSNEA